jgi:predicted oxidoreductase
MDIDHGGAMSTRRAFLAQTVASGLLSTGAAPLAYPLATSAADQVGASFKTCRIPHTDLVVSRVAYGCANIVDWDAKPLSAEATAQAIRRIRTAHDQGITFFDLADIYGFWKAESAFGAALKQSPGLRDRLVIQSKCGSSQHDAPLCNDSSYKHIIESIEGSLRRLGTDHLDLLLLHQPDALIEPAEVAAAFDDLKRSGKVRYFGVSNYSATQIDLLKKNVAQPLVANQVPLGLGYPNLIVDSFTGAGGTLDHCRLHDIQIQAYAPLRTELINPPADAAPPLREAAQVLSELARQKGSTPAAVALAWVMRHPAGIVPIIGATNPAHIIEDCAADRVTLNREEWYALFSAVLKMAGR